MGSSNRRDLVLFMIYRAPDKVRIFISKTSISLPNPMFDHLFESSHRDDSNKWSNIGFGLEIKELASIEINFMHLIWHSDKVQVLGLLSHFKHFTEDCDYQNGYVNYKMLH